MREQPSDLLPRFSAPAGPDRVRHPEFLLPGTSGRRSRRHRPFPHGGGARTRHRRNHPGHPAGPAPTSASARNRNQPRLRGIPEGLSGPPPERFISGVRSIFAGPWKLSTTPGPTLLCPAFPSQRCRPTSEGVKKQASGRQLIFYHPTTALIKLPIDFMISVP
jgi:hypothetical protein